MLVTRWWLTLSLTGLNRTHSLPPPGVHGAPCSRLLCIKGASHAKGSRLGSSRDDVGDRERRVCIKEYPAAEGGSCRRASVSISKSSFYAPLPLPPTQRKAWVGRPRPPNDSQAKQRESQCENKLIRYRP
jgi:hypothetical protein